MIGDILQPTHLLFILVIALIVLGPKRLPEVGRSLGRGLRDFRSAISGQDQELPEGQQLQSGEGYVQPQKPASATPPQSQGPESATPPQEPATATAAPPQEPAQPEPTAVSAAQSPASQEPASVSAEQDSTGSA